MKPPEIDLKGRHILYVITIACALILAIDLKIKQDLAIIAKSVTAGLIRAEEYIGVLNGFSGETGASDSANHSGIFHPGRNNNVYPDDGRLEENALSENGSISRPRKKRSAKSSGTEDNPGLQESNKPV